MACRLLSDLFFPLRVMMHALLLSPGRCLVVGGILYLTIRGCLWVLSGGRGLCASYHPGVPSVALSGGRRHSVSYHPGVPLGAVWWSGTLCFLPSGGAIGG